MENLPKESAFLKAIEAYAKERRMERDDRVAKVRRKEFLRVEAQALKDAYILIQQEMAKRKTEKMRQVSREETIARKELFKKREEIAKGVFQKAADILREFVKSPEYGPWLEVQLEAIFNRVKEADVKLFVLPKDEVIVKEICKKLGESGEISCDGELVEIGGVKAHCEGLNLELDLSIGALLREEEPWLFENSELGFQEQT